MWERERFLIALRNFIPNAQVPGKAHDLGIYGARAIALVILCCQVEFQIDLVGKKDATGLTLVVVVVVV